MSIKGYWPTEDEARELLEASSRWKRLNDFYWIHEGHNVTDHNAILLAQVRIALGQERNLTDTLTTELFAELVKRVVRLEGRS